MAIGFGRVEFIKRSEGRNSCQLSAYLSRTRILFEGNCALEPKLYDFSHRENVSHQEIIVPEGADENLKVAEVLWNLVEKNETRKDAQVSMHLVLALPDDKEIFLEDRIELTRSFIKKHYGGLVAECVIHPPERKIEFTEDNEALGIPRGTIGTVIEEKEGNYIVTLPRGVRPNPFVEIGTGYKGMSVQEHNWHAHAQLTTRRLKANGKEFEDKKALDLMPVVKKGKVISGPDVGKLWAEHQNAFFLSKGLSLRVDDNGLVPQEHLGPVRMRARAFSLLEEHQKRLELNGLAASDPKNILSAMTTRQSVFSKDDVERFILKHTPVDKVPEVIEGFWKQEDLVQLRDKKSQAFVSVFTAKNVLEEERQMVRLADRIHAKPQLPIPERVQGECAKNLSKEQTLAYKNILNGKGLSCIQGYAGVGKSYLLKALKDAYEEKGLIVRSFGPDNATANVLKEKGFSQSENLYRFLYSQKHGLRQVHKGFEVWILDEAGKVGNRPFLEFLKLAEAKGAKVILSGDHSQLPPVERGEAFKHFCTRYQTEVLEEIQRQKDEDSRAMAKDLAMGKTGEALDKLSAKGAIKWSPTKKEAMEELILAWAKEHRGTSQEGQKNALETSLIIAQSNSEVRALNEMVRLIRKERGEISAREFRCEVVSGSQDKATLFVSEGDRIEFRKKDSDLGVKNGDVGVLLRAEEKKFVVALQENGKKVRLVGFDPQKYRGFQLGYASTAQRVQGRTVDRAFVLHSPYLNKQMAYVKLTRHVDQVSYFVSKEEAANLSDLKRQALRDGSKKATYDYTDTEAIEKQNAGQRKEAEVKALRNEEKLSSRFKGLTLRAWEHIKGKTSEYIEKKHDRTQSPEFFSFKDESTSSKGNVQEVTKEHAQSIVLSEPSETISSQEVVEKIITQDYAIQKNSKLSSKSDSKKELALMLNDKEGNRQDSSTSIDFSWKDLSKEEKKLIKGYYSAATKAQELREVVQAESGEALRDNSTSPHYQQWQKACAQRNAFAHLLKPFLSKSESKRILKDSSIYYIGVHAKRHEEILQAREEQALNGEKLKNLESSLASHIEPLLHKLFPDGPSAKASQGYRFGAKGSLSVTCAGSKAGQFYDFERGEGGGLLTLIERELKLNRQEAKAWAGEFLGIAEEIKLPATFQRSNRPVEASDWISLKPNPKLPAPSFEKIGKLHHYYKEVARHPYHDLSGNLLYYILRLENDKGEKITPPLSYGRYEGQEPSWQLKGYSPEGEKRPLYNLHQLKEKPLAEVLIVEGEKTADRALEKFADERYVCLTWSGGSASVSKTDWSPLQGRKVKIWPDNDKAGFKAAANIVDELKKVGAEKISLPNSGNLFERLPPKWDLADPLPEGVTTSSLHGAFSYSNENHFQESVLRRLHLDKPGVSLEKTKAIDLLYAYEKTHKERLEGEFPKEISLNERDTIQYRQQHEGVTFLKKEEELLERVKTDPQINASGELATRLTHQIHLHEARTGHAPMLTEILTFKEVMESFPYEAVKCPLEMKEIALYRALSISCEKALIGQEIDQKEIERTALQNEKELSLQKELTKAQELTIEKQQALELAKGPELSL